MRRNGFPRLHMSFYRARSVGTRVVKNNTFQGEKRFGSRGVSLPYRF